MDVKYNFTAYKRVLELASTPSWDEFSKIGGIAGIGISLIGILGFVIFTLMNLLPGA